MVTVKEVARHAGVSLGTVSRVLNGASNVSLEMRARVEASIQSLGYLPNNAARSLVRRESGAIAVLLRNLHSSFFNDLIRGFEDAMQREKRNVFFCSLSEDQSVRDKYIKFLTGGVADAIILYGSLYSDQPLIEHLQKLNFPFLLIENNFENLRVNQFLIRNEEGAEEGVSYLIAHGHRRIAHFMGDMNKKVHLDRFAGYTQAMQRHGLHIDQQSLFNIFKDYPLARQFARELIRRPVSERPTAIFCSNDLIAAHVITAVLEEGYKVPDDLSVLAFDNQIHPFPEYAGPRITSLYQPLYQIGVDAIEELAALISGTRGDLITRYYDTVLMEHETVGPPPAE